MSTPEYQCKSCQSQGLAIMPLRYAVIPEYISIADYRVPDWAKNKTLEQLKLSNRSRYGVRIMRKGYLYILEQRNNRPRPQWLCYIIDEFGRFTLHGAPHVLPDSPDYLQPCTLPRGGVGHVNSSFICITNPETCVDAWIAYSEHKWEDETVERYLSDMEVRNKRMQHIKPARWVNGYTYSYDGVAVLSPEALSGVVERHSQKMMYNGFMGEKDYQGTLELTASTEEEPFKLERAFFYRHSKTNISPRLSPLRNDDVWEKNLLEASRKRSSPNSPTTMMVALWDPIGVIDELTGWLEQLGNNIEAVKIERQWEIETGEALTTLQSQINEAALKQLNGQRDELRKGGNSLVYGAGVSYSDDKELDSILLPIKSLSEQAKKPLSGSGMYQLFQEKAAKYVQDVETKQGLMYFVYKPKQVELLTSILNSRSPDMEERNTLAEEFDKVKKEWDDMLFTQEVAQSNHLVNTQMKEWQKYNDQLNQNRLNSFNKHYEAFLQDTLKYQEALTQDLMIWLNKGHSMDSGSANFDFDHWLKNRNSFTHPFEQTWLDLKRDNPRRRFNLNEALLQVLGCSALGHAFFEKELSSISPDKGFNLIADCVCLKGLSPNELSTLKSFSLETAATRDFIESLETLFKIEISRIEEFIDKVSDDYDTPNPNAKPKLAYSGSHMAIIYYFRQFQHKIDSQFGIALQWLIGVGGGMTKESMSLFLMSQLKDSQAHTRAVIDAIFNNKAPERYFTSMGTAESERFIQTQKGLTPVTVEDRRYSTANEKRLRRADTARVLLFLELYLLVSVMNDDRVKSLEAESLDRLRIMASVSAITLFTIKSFNPWIDTWVENKLTSRMKELSKGIKLPALHVERVIQAQKTEALAGIKVFGHYFGAISAGIGVIVLYGRLDKRDHELIIASRIFNTVVGGLSAADFVSRIVVREGLVKVIAARAIAAQAGQLMAQRAAFEVLGWFVARLLSWQMALILFAVEVVLSFFTKTGLEKWFQYSRFGKKYSDNNAYQNLPEQIEALERITEVEKWREIDEKRREELRKLLDPEELKKHGSPTD